MLIVFISGPYRGNVAHNIAIARKHAEKIWQAGYCALCPHLNSAHMDGLCDDSAFLEGDMAMLRRSDMIYLIPGWERSIGARAEWEEAKRLLIPRLILNEDYETS